MEEKKKNDDSNELIGLDFKLSELLKGPSHTLPQPRVILQYVFKAMIPQIRMRRRVIVRVMRRRGE